VAPALPRNIEDIGPRILSAVALIPLALGAAVAGGPWLAGATGAAVVAMSWEWASMSRPDRPMRPFWLTMLAALGAVMLASRDHPLLALAWATVAGLAAALNQQGLRRRAEAFAGALYVSIPCVAFLWIRAYPAHGLLATIALFAIIWTADGAAYFAGRLIGGPRLLPNLSTQKTVAGLVGAVLAGGAAGWCYGGLIGGPQALWTIAGLALASVGMAGDLLESMIKRRFGVKDASQLIPGHGGVLDRLDGLMAASVTAAAALVMAQHAVGGLFETVQ
jgi:phosphatidate cytidylyltransferase